LRQPARLRLVRRSSKVSKNRRIFSPGFAPEEY